MNKMIGKNADNTMETMVYVKNKREIPVPLRNNSLASLIQVEMDKYKYKMRNIEELLLLVPVGPTSEADPDKFLIYVRFSQLSNRKYW